MTEPAHEDAPDGATQARRQHDAERQEIAETQDRLDAEADGEGLAAEAGAGEENGLSEG